MTTSSLIAVPDTDSSGVRYALLGRREIDVLGQFLIDGAGNHLIGKRMFLTEDTVKCHFRAIFRKTGTSSRAALAIAVLSGEVFIMDPQGRRVRF